MLDLVAGLSNQHCRHILQHNRLQGEAAWTFPWLDQGTSMQSIDSGESTNL